MPTDDLVKLLPEEQLRKACPLKWNDDVHGSALGIADIDFRGPSGVVEFIAQNLSEDYGFYQQHEGLIWALQAGVNFLLERHIPASLKNIQVIPGTMLGIYAAMAWGSRQAGEIALINPLYPPILEHAEQQDESVRYINLDSDWRLDSEKVKEEVSAATAVLGLVNPNNPTGTNFHEDELKLLADLAVDYNFTIFSDELYEPLTYGRHIPMGSFDQLEDRLITLYGFSKAYGLAGFRSGFMYINHSKADEIKLIVEKLLVAPSPVSSLVMEYALTDTHAQQWKEQFAKKMQQTTEFATKYLNDCGFPTVQPEGTFFVFPNMNVDDDKKLAYYLQDNHKVQAVPGSLFGPAGNGHLRVNCATSLERLEIGLQRIIEGTEKYNKSRQ